MIRRPRVGPGRKLLLGVRKPLGDWWNQYGAIPQSDIFAVYTPKDAADYASSLLDISGNGNHASTGTAPGWSGPNGWMFDAASSEYLITTFTPAADQSQSMIVQFNNHFNNGGCPCGMYDDANSNFYLVARVSASDDRAYGNGQLALAGVRVAAGNLCVAGNAGYYNGADEGVALGAWVGAAARTVHIGRLNAGAPVYFTGYIPALAIYNCTLNAAHVAALYEEMKTRYSMRWYDLDGAIAAADIYGAWQPKGARNLAHSYKDISGNGNDVGVGVAPTWAVDTGWMFDAGSGQYLTTAFVPANDQSQSILVQFSNVTTTNDLLCGCFDGVNNYFYLQPNYAVTSSRFYANGQPLSVAGMLTSGNLGIAGNQGYYNGSADGGAIGAWAGESTRAMYIGANNNAGVVQSHITAYIQALAIYNRALTANEVQAVAARMAAI